MNGALLTRWMEENNVRAEDIASKLGISVGTVQRARNGKTVYTSTLRALSNFTGIPESELRASVAHRSRKSVAS